MPKRKLFLASFLVLFFELMFIRWLPDAVHFFGFFSNFVLLACFLGLGTGLARPLAEGDTDERILRRFVGLCLVQMVLYAIFLEYRLEARPPNEGVFLNDDASMKAAQPSHLNMYLTLALFTTLMAMTFVPLGQLLKRYFEKFRPLEAYTIDILGSLFGIGAFSLLSFLCTPPSVWIGVGFLLLLFFLERHRAAFAAFSLILALGVFGFERHLEQSQHFEKFWSPYYNIRLHTQPNLNVYIQIGNSVLLNGLALDKRSDLDKLDPATRQAVESYESSQDTTSLTFFRDFYSYPYRFVKPKRVLILGGGLGNDVAMALLQNVERVDVVEIDPIVARLGRIRHPMKAYQDPRVHLINDDARAYIRRCQEKYDLIIFGTLDSHGLFSMMSSVKLENYVYTRECFTEASKLLTDHGIMYVNVGYMGPFVPFRLFETLTQVFGKEPLFCFYNQFSQYICSKGELPIPADLGSPLELRMKVDRASLSAVPWDQPQAVPMQFAPSSLVLPTDDWPQLYLEGRKVPYDYLIALTILLAISVVLIRWGVSGARFKFHAQLFLLGAGFMLIETKSITELGLIFGATWFVNSVVIAGILTMIFLANLWLLRQPKKPGLTLPYLGLFGVLLVLYLVPVREMSVGAGPVATAGAVAFILLPMLFAAIIFGVSFDHAELPAAALASNMLGAMVGGTLEFSSMVFGLRSLYLTALALYLLSFALMPRLKE